MVYAGIVSPGGGQTYVRSRAPPHFFARRRFFPLCTTMLQSCGKKARQRLFFQSPLGGGVAESLCRLLRLR
jgi:hypothetical protein